MNNILYSQLNNSTLFRALVFVSLISLIYLLVNFNINLANDDSVREVLKQLITFTSLVITLIYAVLIPGFFFEKEKRANMIDSYIGECRKVYLIQQFCFSFAELIHRVNKDFRFTSERELYYLLYGREPSSIDGNRSPYFEKEFFDFLERIIEFKEQPDDVQEAKAFHQFRTAAPESGEKHFIMLNMYLHEFVNPAGRAFYLYASSGRLAFSPLQLQHLKFSLSGILNHCRFGNSASLAVDNLLAASSDFGITMSQAQFSRLRKVALEGIILSTDYEDVSSKLNVKLNGMSFLIEDVLQSSVWKIQLMIDNLDYIMSDLNLNKHRSIFISSFACVVFGILVPLFLLHFDVKDVLRILSIYCTEISVGLLMSFLWSVYELFSVDSNDLDFQAK